jgi:WD40 repeat protein
VLATCSEDKRLGFIDSSGKIAHIIKKAHENPINRVHFASEQIVLSGDDEGVIKVWDLRQSESIFQVHEQTEAITGFYFDEAYTNIISSCLDGTVAVYDLKQGNDSANKLYAISDSADEELNNVFPMKNGRYLICPSSENSVLVFKRDSIEHFVDRITGQPGSV